MTQVGVIGLGSMGSTHLDVYAKLEQAKVVAVCDTNPDLLSGKKSAQGNIEGQAQGGFDLNMPGLAKYRDSREMIEDPQVQLVDICVPTPWHADIAKAALKAGKHVLLEKPLVRHSSEIDDLLAVAEQSQGMVMCAMCMRFWPHWVWLKQAVDQKTYGKVLGATFRRLASHPPGAFYSNGDQCGGAALDLHIHDVDFIQHLFGIPKAVSSRGYAKPTSEIDHISTQYIYDDIPLVTAEGGWAMAPDFGFVMQYMVNFEQATAVFDMDAENHLMLYEKDQKPQAVEVPSGMGYEHEIKYLLDCIAKGTPPARVTLEDASRSIRIVEAEIQSAKTGQMVSLA